jgi:hypothetical protein
VAHAIVIYQSSALVNMQTPTWLGKAALHSPHSHCVLVNGAPCPCVIVELHCQQSSNDSQVSSPTWASENTHTMTVLGRVSITPWAPKALGTQKRDNL